MKDEVRIYLFKRVGKGGRKGKTGIREECENA